jgi:phosphoribosyl 1,2-cyclic phosphodiesterase
MITFTPYSSSSSGNLYTVSDGQTTVMLDCGLTWKKAREKLGFNTSEIAGVLLTHFHSDHCKGARDAAKAGLDIYASKETFQHLQMYGHRVNIIEHDVIFSIGSWHIQPFKTIHDVEGSMGFYMFNPFSREAFLYMTDTQYSPVRFSNLSVIAVECNFSDDILSDNILKGYLPAAVGHRVRRAHLSLEVLIELLKANNLSNCKEIFLLHLSRGNSDEAKMIEEVQKATGIPCKACEE